MYNQRFFEFPHWVEPWEVQSPRHYFPVYQTPNTTADKLEYLYSPRVSCGRFRDN